MPSQGKNSLLFDQREDEAVSIFLIEDLIKEYNSKVIETPSFLRKAPLSLRSFDINKKNLIIQPMSYEEINSIKFYELNSGDWFHLKKILSDQITPKGLVNNAPNLASGATILEVVNELGLKGKIEYKKIGEKIYVILKGRAKDRTILKGTRYLNTHPDIIRFGLAKISVQELYKVGFKTSILVYSGIKAIEGLGLYLTGEFESNIFSEIITDIPKLAISTAVGSASAGTVAMFGLPVALGAGIVFAVGISTNIALDLLDQKIQLTEKLSEAADVVWRNLNRVNDIPSYKQGNQNINTDLLNGLIDKDLEQQSKVSRAGEHLVYIV
ncbi:MAG: hypothetical protein LW832_04820 [Parachlamydia sp.]|jgi:hypothetical protein|nr:hypothetical protein [Parachlamydia sp.]